MHVLRLKIRNVRSLHRLDLDLGEDKETSGWHVIIGDNGSGKSTIVRALALAFIGPENAMASRQDWSKWLSNGKKFGHIISTLSQHKTEDRWSGKGRTTAEDILIKATFNKEINNRNRNSVRVKFESNHGNRTIWNGSGWFSASFGAFRRFSGSDPEMDMLYLSHPLLAPHLSALGENVALGASLRWLSDLQIRALEGDSEAKKIQDEVINFVNGANLLPHRVRIKKVTAKRILLVDGDDATVAIEEMSDGYRSILSLLFELMRIMFVSFGTEAACSKIDTKAGTVLLSGVVAIDEIDAHLHPAWQKFIGDWFVEHFPYTQFFVTTHSPIICRAARQGSVWLLPAPGSSDFPRRITGSDLDRLIDGDILDAYGTEIFGEDVTRSERSKEKLQELAQLNRKRLSKKLTAREQRRLNNLRATMSSSPSDTAPMTD